MKSPRQNIINNIEYFVKQKLKNDATGHDWWHIKRVRDLAIKLGKIEGADLFIVEIASLLHDLDDYKLTGIKNLTEPVQARSFLEKLKVEQTVIQEVCDIINQMSYKGSKVETKMTTLEGMVVQDADRLDAMGAIGIARTFAYGGAKGRKIFDPQISPKVYKSFKSYQANSSPTINHFYEKLLLLKDLMNTEAAKQIAIKRHEILKNFLDEFYAEWEGKDLKSNYKTA